jgi:L-ascorbate metabolism protein UlaG (beta-lactamase superfamily)
MLLSYYGHSCFSVKIEGKTLLFDPFITYNELAKDLVRVEEMEADYILVSHGHVDHIADCISIAKRTGAKVIASWEIHEWLQKQGISNTHPMNTGGKWNFGEFVVKCTAAQHSSGLPDGSYGGNPMGFIIMGKQGNFYYSGDTALTLDMQLIPRWAKLNFAVLPIGDNFTMDAEDAVTAPNGSAVKPLLACTTTRSGLLKSITKRQKKHLQMPEKNCDWSQSAAL